MIDFKIISGRSNLDLSNKITNLLGISLTKVKIIDFANTEISVKIEDNVRNFHIYIIQTGGPYQGRSINDHLQELYALIQACKLSSVKSINLIMPCYAYARGDKKDTPRVAIMAACQAKIYESLGINRIVSMDLHAGQIQGFLPTIPFDNLYGINIHIKHLKNTLFRGMSQDEINNNYVLAAPDVGASKMLENYAKKLHMKYVLMHKHRNYDEPNLVFDTILVGDSKKIENKTVIIIDDMCDTMGTMVAAVNELKKYNILNVIVIVTHGVLSGPAIDRINTCELMSKVIVTNTLPQQENLERCAKLEIVDTSSVFAEVIRRLRTGNQSISEMFL